MSSRSRAGRAGQNRTAVLYCGPQSAGSGPERPVAPTPYAELHCHTNFSFLDGASAPDELVERAVELGLTGLAVTDHNGLYGAVRFVSAAEAVGLHPVIGIEIELLDAAVADPDGIVVPPRRPRRPVAWRAASPRTPDASEGLPRRPRPSAPACPAIASRSRRTCAASASGSAVPTSCCWPARRSAGGACAVSCRAPTWPAPRASRGSARRSSPSTPRASSRCPAAATGRWRAGSGRAIAPAPGPSPSGTRRSSGGATGRRRAASSSSCRTTSCPTTTGSSPRRRRWPSRPGCRSSSPTTSTTPAPEDRELADVLTAIRHGRSLETLGDLRRPDGESYLKSGAELAALGTSTRGRGGPGVGGGHLDGGRARGVVLGRSRLRAVPLPGLPGARTARRRSRTSPSCAGRARGSATTR